ncbi:hypothetical protein PoB_000992400 [Plakobranchus ocellatus]|uniref:Uncharacterized protein n=1 Tax=Plakobranchus ocellatus TaxID=259542 RepID=A0AAV3YMS8_9GAST|nr:hypothetical protein PoB_000992400 [Plakobranchus ocellatus]
MFSRDFRVNPSGNLRRISVASHSFRPETGGYRTGQGKAGEGRGRLWLPVSISAGDPPIWAGKLNRKQISVPVWLPSHQHSALGVRQAGTTNEPLGMLSLAQNFDCSFSAQIAKAKSALRNEYWEELDSAAERKEAKQKLNRMDRKR